MSCIHLLCSNFFEKREMNSLLKLFEKFRQFLILFLFHCIFNIIFRYLEIYTFVDSSNSWTLKLCMHNERLKTLLLRKSGWWEKSVKKNITKEIANLAQTWKHSYLSPGNILKSLIFHLKRLIFSHGMSRLI